MEEKKLTIGEMASLNKISNQTLRLYDKMGLFKPDYVDSETGYRYYSIKQCAKLDIISYLKGIGMNLREIKLFFETRDLSFLTQILKKQVDDISTKIEELQLQQKAIKDTLQSFEQFETAPKDGTITLEYIQTRRIYSMISKINFYDYGLDVYEKILRTLKEELICDNSMKLYYRNAGTVLKKENFLKSNFYSTEFFVFIDEHLCFTKNNRIINGGLYLCIYCDSFSKEKEYAKKLLNYIQSQDYTVSGDYLCECLAEIPVFNDKERGMFLRLQVPIEYK